MIYQNRQETSVATYVYEKHQQPSMQPMQVLEACVYQGPHLYSRTPMIRIRLDLGSLENFSTSRLTGFPDALTQRLPGLISHGCSYGEPGGFIKRMEEGTWLGHVIEHVALELQTMVGNPVTRGKTRSVKGKPGLYDVMYAYKDEAVALAAGRFALELVDNLLPPELRGVQGGNKIAPADGEYDFAVWLEQLRELAADRALGPTTASIVREAERRGIPTRRLNESSLVVLGYGRHQRRICASCSDLTSEVATEIAADKDITKLLLKNSGVPVPLGELARSPQEAVEAAQRLGYPVVTKPLDGNHGRGVNIGLSSPEDIVWGFEQAQEHSRTVIIEQYFTGADHRILVINGAVVAVAKRVPACVTGDGRKSIADLVEEVNSDPRRGEGHSSVLTRIKIDECVEHFLKNKGLTPNSVPALNETVYLRPTANLSTGGTAIDQTDEIHPENAMITVRAAKIVGLDIAGIDFVCPDISKPVSETGGGVIEVNAGPGFRMHLEPSEGRPRSVARPVIDMLFPNGHNGRIPIFAITGTNGKSTTARMLGHILQHQGSNVGLTSTTGIYINGQRIETGDCSGPRSAQTVLSEPDVDVAVLECARGGILREGLAFDECDVGAVLNVAPDHLGLKGINTLEDLAAVKSVVVESVRRDGWSILNADDEQTAGMAGNAGGRICYFSLRDKDQWPNFLAEHIADGGRAITRQQFGEGWDVVVHEDGEALHLMNVSDIPATFDGAAEFNVANALAAIAMAHCHGVAVSVICDAMSRFSTSFELSPGRLNVHDSNGFRTIMDYAHNPDGLAVLGKLVGGMKRNYNCTIGLVGISGDRRDADILRMGSLAARIFDIVIFKEGDELRGREPGALAALLRDGALSTGCSPSHIHTVLPEAEAVDLSLRLATQGDLVVITADDIEAVWKQITSFDGTRLEAPLIDHNVRHLRAS
jgi:cyanophycin synthetase